MHNKSAAPTLTRTPQQLFACAAAGLVLGQVVLGLAARHDGALTGLVCALLFVVCGSASLLLGLLHLHGTLPSQGLAQQRPRAPLLAWLLVLAAALLASMHLGSLPLA